LSSCGTVCARWLLPLTRGRALEPAHRAPGVPDSARGRRAGIRRTADRTIDRGG
jgi:hypothetical protein